MKYETVETTSKLILNISRLIKFGPYKEFTRSVNLDINLSDESQGMYYRHYILLSVMLLTRYVSYSAFYPIYKKICDKPQEGISNDLRHFFSHKRDAGVKFQGKKYKNILQVTPDVFGTNAAVELMGNGLSYYKKLNSLIRFTPEIHKLNDGEIDALYAASRSRQPGAHYFYTYQVATTFLASLRSNFIEDFSVEAERGDYYDYSLDARIRGAILPDISMRYRTSSEYLSTVFLEADRATEHRSKLLSKCRNELEFSYKQTRSRSQFPNLIIFVTDKEPQLETIVKKPVDKTLKLQGMFLKKIGDDDVIGLIQGLMLLYEHLQLATGVNEYYASILQLDGLIDLLLQINEKKHGGFYEQCSEVMEKFKETIICYRKETGDLTLGIDDFYWFQSYCSEKSSELLKPDRETIEEKVAVTLNSRKFLVARNMQDRFSQIHFLSGQSLAFVPVSELPMAIKSLIPYLAAQPNVKAVARVFEFTGLIKKYWSVHPSCQIGNEYYINKRNSFRFDDTILFFEDLSYDLSAIVRLREYLSISPDLISNTMGCFIVNDDLTVSTGEHIADTYYWRAGRYESNEYQEMFLKRVDKNGRVPYFFSIGADFCIIKRSEYLSGDPSQIHPFVIFGHEESDIIYRTTEGMDSVKPFHMGGMNVYLPITHPEEFDHYV